MAAALWIRGSGTRVRALAEEGRQYAVFLAAEAKRPRQGTVTMALALPAGEYRVEWIDTRSGAVAKRRLAKHGGGGLTVSSPAFEEDVALRVIRAR